MRRITFYLIILLALNSCATQHPNSAEANINQFLDAWHQAAATADEDGFFDQFSEDGIYIGTDPTEHWPVKEFRIWAQKAFARDTAWAFQPYDRHIYFSKNQQIVWFDELLNTDMGICRGSGVLIKENNQWKIAHYHLSVAVPNDKLEEYLEILKDEN